MEIFGLRLLSIFFVLLLLWVSYFVVESIRRATNIKGEVARKTVHILFGIVMASLPLFMSQREIIITLLLTFIIVLAFKVTTKTLEYLEKHKSPLMKKMARMTHVYKNLFDLSAYEDVNRWSIGEFLYPLGLLIVAVFFYEPGIFSFTVLILAFADGFAALFGKKFGVHKYKTLGATKSLEGSLAFFVESLALMGTYAYTTSSFDIATIGIVIGGSLLLTISEAIAGWGADNLLIPIVAAVCLGLI